VRRTSATSAAEVRLNQLTLASGPAFPHESAVGSGAGCGLSQFLRPIPRLTMSMGKGHWAHAELFNAVPPGLRQLLSTNEYGYGQTLDLHCAHALNVPVPPEHQAVV
jgi:hypothetical protein